MVVADEYEKDRIMLGKSFLSSYNVTMKFDDQIIGLQGYLG